MSISTMDTPMDVLSKGNAASIESTSMEMTSMKSTSMDMASIHRAWLSNYNRRGWLLVGGETDESMTKIGQRPLISHAIFLNSLSDWQGVNVSSMPIGVSYSVGVSSTVVSTMC